MQSLSLRKNAEWQLNWPSYGAGLASGLVGGIAATVGYYALNSPKENPTNTWPSFSSAPYSTDTTSYAAPIINGLLLGAFLIACYSKYSSGVAKEEKMKQELSSKIKLNLDSIEVPSPEEQRAALQKWWDLGKCQLPDFNMPNLTTEHVELLYKILNKIHIELEKSPDKTIYNPLMIFPELHKPFYIVDFDNMSKWEQASPVNEPYFKIFLGGFILSQEKSYFAYGIGRAANLSIFPNKTFEMDIGSYSNAGMTIYSREGKFNGSKSPEWKIEEDGVCRLVKEDQQKEKIKPALIDTERSLTNSSTSTNTNIDKIEDSSPEEIIQHDMDKGNDGNALQLMG